MKASVVWFVFFCYTYPYLCTCFRDFMHLRRIVKGGAARPWKLVGGVVIRDPFCRGALLGLMQF